MIRVGVVDFDSSHSVEFTRRLNRQGVAEEQGVDGARVVLGCALPSAITPQEQVDRAARVFREELGIPLVSRPEEMLGKIDAVLIESVDGSVHLERARPFLEAGLPTFVDKPFTCSLAQARALVELAAKRKAPLFSSSSLRYAPELVEFRNREFETGRVLGCDAYSPAATHPRNPGLFHYGIHGVETLFAVMGPGCETAWCVSEGGAEVVVGRWRDGRLGTVRGTRSGTHGYGFTAFCEKRTAAVPLGTRFIYRELLVQVVSMFRTGRSPLPPEVTLEIVGFIEAAIHSSREQGAPRPVGV